MTQFICSSHPCGRRSIWNKVDVKDVGQLDEAAVGKVLKLLGLHLSETQLSDMLTKEFGQSHTNEAIENEATEPSEGAAKAPLIIFRDEFVASREKDAPTAALPIGIFFVQTFGLLAKDASLFGFAEALNLDPEEATGQCLSNFTFTERFFSKVLLTPLMISLGILASAPVWNFLRRKLPAKLWEKVAPGAPPKLERVHLQRAALNAFLFCFAPLTRAAVETLVYAEPCYDDAPVCATSLAFDMQVKYFEGDHAVAVVTAVLVLVSMAIVIPVFLLFKVRRSRFQRDASLNLKADQVDTWFVELDADGSGSLEGDEVKELLRRMGQDTRTKTMKKVMIELDPDGSGSASKPEFEVWFRKQLEGMLSTPFDVLYGTNTAGGYWWFMQTLWVKTGINM